MAKSKTLLENRDRYRALLERASITQAESARLLDERVKKNNTGQTCSDRTVRSWLADPALPSARPCPDWAVNLLHEILVKKKLIEE
jgi:hypothetical protein